jgi:hypothetical protein
MTLPSHIDLDFDFQLDTPPGKDPDTFSPTLRSYHKLLWSKPLPSGAMFDLRDTPASTYLYHRSVLGEFFLASDGAITTFRNESRLAAVFAKIPAEEQAEFKRATYTIGGMIVFPAVRVTGKMTINQARGFHPRIKDRFDLTVECIRRHYLGEHSPLRDVLARNTDFFDLFGSFQGYVQHFLLQDLVTDDCSAVKFFSPFEDFNSSPVPDSMAAYLGYRELAVGFIEARNERIKTWWTIHRVG